MSTSPTPEKERHPLLRTIDTFSNTTRAPLREYQLECARAVVDSVMHGRGKIFTVMFARQMGKNETSAHIEAYLMALYQHEGGNIVKAAPAFKPQVIGSILRLKETLDASPLTRDTWRPSFGYMIALGEARTTFLSADTTANVVGATASLLLEIDEAQDVDPDKYDREFRPMASSTNATTVLYGTAWNETSLLERQRKTNLDREEAGDPQVHFEYAWKALADLKPAYKTFVEAEIERLGIGHPTIQTQYLLHPLSDAGRLFSAAQKQAMHGTHERRRDRLEDEMIVAGIDLAGEDEQSERALSLGLVPRRDSTVVTIGRVTRDASGSPSLEVIDHVWWTGREYVWQYHRLLELWDRWHFTRVAVDASGIGAAVAAFLAKRHDLRLDRVIFTAQSKSKMAYEALSMANTDRLQIYGSDGSAEWRQCWKEITACRYEMRLHELMSWQVPASEGHDDFVASLLLCCKAASEVMVVAESGLVRGRGYDMDVEW
jgi:hypothetical protein